METSIHSQILINGVPKTPKQLKGDKYMTNKEKFINELAKYATSITESFAIDKYTGNMCSCNYLYSEGLRCCDCAFKASKNCHTERLNWLNQEYNGIVKSDYWKDFRHLKAGDTVLVRYGEHYVPAIVIELAENYLHYGSTFDENGRCIIHSTTINPDHVKLIKED